MSIFVIQTGGTIDKDYPKRHGGYAFEIGDSAAKSILQRHSVTLPVEYGTAFRKDSQDISKCDRELLGRTCTLASQEKILITHGTDTIIETAEFLAMKKLQKTIMLTGSFLPETFKNSDAEFNVGAALGALQCITAHNVFIAMNGKIFPWSLVTRDEKSGQFISKP
ncbi:glutaminase-asparaginase-like [Glandiceps talaboti]